MTRFWKAGYYVVLREIWRGQVRSGRPYTVVEDTPSRLVLYAGAGVRWMRPVGPDGTPLRMRGPSWTLREEVSTQESLRIITPGSRHSIILFWTEGFQELLQWYVNLEEPLVRTPIGFDYLDQMLDIVVASDLSEWTWKDEDELEATVARGILSTEEADIIRAEGERVIAALNERRPPFAEPWGHWRPDPSWPAAGLPQGWCDLGRYPPYGSGC